MRPLCFLAIPRGFAKSVFNPITFKLTYYRLVKREMGTARASFYVTRRPSLYSSIVTRSTSRKVVCPAITLLRPDCRMPGPLLRA